jgi:hypothetical protein
LCLIVTSDLSQVAAVSNLYLFPDFPLDSQMGSMESGARSGMDSDVAAYDLDGNGLHLSLSYDDTDSFRDVLNQIGQQFQSIFNVNQLVIPGL